jgi:hypothetical protein
MIRIKQALTLAVAFAAYVTVKTIYIIPTEAPEILVQSL